MVLEVSGGLDENTLDIDRDVVRGRSVRVLEATNQFPRGLH